MLFDEVKRHSEAIINELLRRWQSSQLKKMYEAGDNLRTGFQRDFLGADVKESQLLQLKKQYTNRIADTIHQFDLGHVYVELNELKGFLKSESVKDSLVGPTSNALTTAIDALWKTLHQVGQAPNSSAVMAKFFHDCETLREGLEYLSYCSKFLAQAEGLMRKPLKPANDESSLMFSLTVELAELPQFNERLDALEEMYEAVCIVFSVDVNEHPLKLLRVESGSLWGDFFGESKVVEFIIWFLKASIRYLHRNFTREGKLAAIPRQLETLEKQMHVCGKLKELLGSKRYEALTAEVDGQLARQMVKIASSTTHLLAGETRLNIDGERIEMKPDDAKLYLLESKKRLSAPREESDQ